MIQYNLPLTGMILLSTPISGNRAALKSFKNRIKEYICKMRNPKYFWKFLSGRANILQIWKTLTTAFGLRNRYPNLRTTHFASKCPILFIHGSGDPLSRESSQYYTAKCKENKLPYDCHFIAGANHSFFHYKWKEEIYSVSKQWLIQLMIEC
jgi:acetyl esterase/lipase